MIHALTPARRRRALTVLALLPLAACGERASGPDAGPSGAPSGQSEPGKPHVVILVADDLGYGDAGFTGGDLPTPRLDALAAESIVLDRFYAAPMCSPSRAQLMTGRSALSLGIVRNVKPKDAGGLPTGLPTVADRLDRRGYRTALVGKWHLGHANPDQYPGARGFDQSYGHLRGWIDYYDHDQDGTHDWHRNGVTLREDGYTTDLIADEAARIVEGHDLGTPLFLVVSFNAPHLPLQPPREWRGDPRDVRAAYGAMVEGLDRGVGRVLDALDTAQIAGDTLVLFFSDNGAHSKGGGQNGPLKGQKYDCTEGGIRTPACVRFPGRLKPGRSDLFVGTVDIAPTVVALAGAEPLPDVEGTDVLMGLERGESLKPRDFVFAVDHARVQRRALLRPPHKLVEIRRDGTVTRTVHNVVEDPYELEDLAGDRPELLGELLGAAPWSD